MLRAQGVPMSPENGQGPEKVVKQREEFLSKGFDMEQAIILAPDWTPESVDTWVVSFPVKSPTGAVTRHDMTAIEQLEWYKTVRNSWCEHNQSITVYIRDDEWLKVGSWVYDNFEHISGVSFLPFDGGAYQQAPYEDLTKEQFEILESQFPKIDYSELSKYELEDTTTGAQALACTAAGCELP
jgi:ribonucleoside-triphosphate reductase